MTGNGGEKRLPFTVKRFFFGGRWGFLLVKKNGGDFVFWCYKICFGHLM